MSEPKKLPKCIHTCMTIGMIPTSYKNSLTYEEQLLWFCKFLEDEVIPVVNNNSAVVEELKHYFDTLDVQEEINNKLDNMAESGQLEEIIAAYLNAKSLLVFDTLSDLKAALNLIEGCTVTTLGYNTINDGGAAKYKIRSKELADTTDDMFLIEITNDESLVAELLINDILNIKQVGITGDNEDDQTSQLVTILGKGIDIYFPDGTYNINSPINTNSHKLIGETKENTIIHYNGLLNGDLLKTYDLEGLEIKNITFDFGICKDATKSHILLTGTSDIKFINCEFANGHGTQLKMNECENIIIDNCYFHDITGASGNVGNGMYLHPVKNLMINNCKCKNIMNDFIYLDGNVDDPVTNVKIKNCEITYTGHNNDIQSSNGIGINGNCTQIYITNNTITNNINGIKTGQRYDMIPNNIFISNNVISNNEQNGMNIVSTNTFITNNKISDNGQDGLYVKECEGITICNNVVNNSSRYGIRLSQVDTINLSSNTVYDNAVAGLFIGETNENSCNNAIINNNMVYKTTNGVQATGVYIAYGDNIILSNTSSFNNTTDFNVNNTGLTNFKSMLNPIKGSSNINSIMYSDSIPAAGKYNVGDIVLFNTPVAEGNIGAVCVTAGTPGTWKTFGSIAE